MSDKNHNEQIFDEQPFDEQPFDSKLSRQQKFKVQRRIYELKEKQKLQKELRDFHEHNIDD